MYNGAKFDQNLKAIRVGKIKMDVDSPEVNSENFTKFNYRLNEEKKLVIDTEEPNRATHAILYTAPKGSRIISVLPGMIAYRFNLMDDQFGIIGREAPELFSSKINPLTIIIQTRENTFLKVSFINKYDQEEYDKVIGYEIKTYVVDESEFKINTYIRIFNGNKFVNRFKFNDDAVIITAPPRMSLSELEDYFGGHRPEKNRVIELPEDQIEDSATILKTLENFKDTRVIFVGYNFDETKRLRVWHDCIKTKKAYSTSLRFNKKTAHGSQKAAQFNKR